MPTKDASDDDIEQIYKEIEQIIDRIPKKEIVIVMGDFNSKLGNTQSDNYLRRNIGNYGLLKRNKRGERFIQFTIDNDLTHSSKKYKNQIDYITIKTRWRTSITTVKTKPSAQYGSDQKKLEAPNKEKLKEGLKAHKQPDTLRESDEIWKEMKSWLVKAIEAHGSTETKINKQKHWMCKETIQKIEERREFGKTNLPVNEKERKIKQLNIYVGETKTTTYMKYVTKLETIFPQPDHTTIHGSQEQEHDILISEVERTIQKIGNRKALGTDGITAKIIKAMGEIGVNIIYKLCRKIWQTRNWPKKWRESIFIPLYKKGIPTDCGNYRTLAFIPHTSKILLTVINERLK